MTDRQGAFAWSGGPIWFVGCGNMGGAMLRQWLAAGLDPAVVTVITRSGRGQPDGVRALTAPPPGERPAVLVLGVKPQMLDDVAPTLSQVEPGLLLSILAGVEEGALADRFRAGAIVRAMPNLPVGIGRGVTALFSTTKDRQARELAHALAHPLGLVEWVTDEGAFDAVTALAGCGPAFLFRFVDAMATAGASLGLPAAQAARLALATVSGAAEMARRADISPATLADQVASPGGSTREGLNVLDRDEALVTLLTETLAASARRNRDMAEAARR